MLLVYSKPDVPGIDCVMVILQCKAGNPRTYSACSMATMICIYICSLCSSEQRCKVLQQP